MVHIPVSSTPSTPPEKVRNFTGASLLGFSLALLICGAVILGNAQQRLITRIGTPGQNDSALLLNFDTGTLEYRVCDNINGTGTVPYSCDPCSKSGRSSGRRGYRSFARDAEALAATDPDASCRRDGYCGASLFFSECSDRSDKLARCFGLDDVVKPYARLTLGACITAILSFGLPVLAFCVMLLMGKIRKGLDDDDPVGVETWIGAACMVVFGGVTLGLAAPSAAFIGTLMNDASLCKDSVVSEQNVEADYIATKSWSERGFAFSPNVERTSIALAVLAGLLLLCGAIAALWAYKTDGACPCGGGAQRNGGGGGGGDSEMRQKQQQPGIAEGVVVPNYPPPEFPPDAPASS